MFPATVMNGMGAAASLAPLYPNPVTVAKANSR